MIKYAILMIIVGAAVAIRPSNMEHDALWAFFKKQFQKKYQPAEEHYKRIIWERNVMRIGAHNLGADHGIHSYKTGLNEYSDLAPEEFVRKMNGFKGPNAIFGTRLFAPPANIPLPATVDWRRHGLVTPVKNQKECSSCYAFSATGSLEGQHMKKTGHLVSLSEQNLVDCSRPEGNFGCEGGLMDYAFEYVIKHGGIDTEASYNYTAEDGPCRFTKDGVGATCSGYRNIPSGDEEALQRAVAVVGPISVAIDASLPSFHSYASGIYYDSVCSSKHLDHGVLLVGYGTENGVDYWLIKNSWGTTWGENGYGKMSRNKNNQCGIATVASFPLV